MKPKINHVTSTTYNIERFPVDGVGNIVGTVVVSDGLSFPLEEADGRSLDTPIRLWFRESRGECLELDYDAVPGLSNYKGMIVGDLHMPDSIPFLKGSSRRPVLNAAQSYLRGPNKRSPEYRKSIRGVYEILATIVTQEESK